LDARLAHRAVVPRQQQVRPALSTLPFAPWLGGGNLEVLRRFLGLAPDGSGSYDNDVLVIALDLGVKNVGVGCTERPGVPNSLICIRVRDGVFLGSEVNLQRQAGRGGAGRADGGAEEEKVDGTTSTSASRSASLQLSSSIDSHSHTGTAFDRQRRREQLHDRVAQEFVDKAIETPPYGIGWPQVKKVVVAVGGGKIEAAFGQRGSKAAGPFISSVVEHFESTFGKDQVVVCIIDEAWTSSRCVRLECRKRQDQPCVYHSRVSSQTLTSPNRLVKYVWAEGPRKGRQFFRVLYCANCGRTINRDEVGAQNILTSLLSIARFGFGTFTTKFAARMGLKWKGVGLVQAEEAGEEES
jgi:hypothetical protein